MFIEDKVQVYKGWPVEMRFNNSDIAGTLQSSFKNIFKLQKKQFLSVLITDINQLQLINQCYKICHIGITGITLEQKKLLSMYYSNRVLIVDQTIKNSFIDILICDNNDLLKKLISNNYIKYIYTINTTSLTLNHYRKYLSTIANSFLYINRITPQAYKQIHFNNKQQNIELPTRKQIIKENIQQKKQVISNNVINKSVAIIIPYYNNQNITIKLLKTLQWYSKSQYKIKVFLISDGSKYQISDQIRKACKKFKNYILQFIFNDNRLGYIKSTNKGIKRALQENFNYIVLMHNDIQVSYNWLSLIDNIKDDVIASCPITNCILDKKQNVKYIRENKVLQNFPQSFQKCKTLTINEKLAIYKNKNIQLNENNFIPNFFCVAFHSKAFKQIGLLNQVYNYGFGENYQFIKKLFSVGYKIQFMPSVYIPHIGRNTFKDFYEIKQFNKNVEIKEYINKIAVDLNFSKKKSKVIYTCITNNYDILKHSIYNTEQFDYVFFGQTNQNLEQPWQFIDIKPMKDIICTDDPIKIARFFKTHPHLFFRNYEQSLWIDGNIDIITDPNNIFNIFLDQEYMLICDHPQRNSIYSEAQICKSMNKDTEQNIDRMLQYFNKEGFKDQSGLVQSGIILRRHKNKQCINLMQYWWKIIKQYSCRDQLSFSFCIQKLQSNILRIDWNLISNKYIKWNGIHGNK